MLTIDYDYRYRKAGRRLERWRSRRLGRLWFGRVVLVVLVLELLVVRGRLDVALSDVLDLGEGREGSRWLIG